ncbi:hypothetical protein FACS1894211_06410 [Clostridia bacterium]|nr:hypothetical protein FACS1894211_06410 [Clostridia bacterium]
MWYPMRWTGIRNGADEFQSEIGITTSGLYFYRFFAKGRWEWDIGAGALAGGGGGGDFVQLVSEPARPPEGWAGGVMYQIFCDRFAVGSGGPIRTKADCSYRDDWGGTPKFLPDAAGEVRNDDFFGGNLDGITEKLDFLKDMSVTSIYLNPIFEAASNHKYDTGDYFRIDPLFGDSAAFRRLCAAARRKGIKIVLDGVFNHTGSDSRYFNKNGRYGGAGAYRSPDSPYFPWFTFKSYPDTYESWWDFKTLPAVKKDSPAFSEFINGADGVAAYWLQSGAGGWRLDVADELSDSFLEALRVRVKAVDPDALIVGEVWENAALKFAYGARRKYFLGKQLDAVMNYPFRTAIIEFARDGNSASLSAAVREILDCYPAGAVANLMNSLSTHDTPRALTVFEGDVSKMRLAAVLQYTLPGFPCVFYGDEAGLSGGKDPFCRGCYPWGLENAGLMEHYKFLGRLRAENRAFAGGEFRLLHEGGGVFIFERRLSHSVSDGAAVMIALNASEREFELETGRPLTDLRTGKKVDGEIAIPARDFGIYKI